MIGWRGGDAHRLQSLHDVRVASIIGASIQHEDASRTAVARGARDAAASLEEGTLNHLDTTDHHLIDRWESDLAHHDVWKVTTRFYSSGVCEVRAFLGSALRRRPVKSFSESLPTDAFPVVKKVSGERFESSIRRSRTILRSRCLELDADHMLTLTKRGKFHSVDEAWSAWKRFSALMTKFYKVKWRYVVVPELHSDGETFHLHAAIKGFYWVGIVRKLWQKALGGTGYEHGEGSLGNIDIKSFRRVRGAAGVRRIAGYIAKYVGKGFTACNRGRRLFASSSGLDPYRVERRVCRYWFDGGQVLRTVQQGLHRIGSSGVGTCYFWSRNKADGSLISSGFVFSTDWRGIAV